MPALSSTSERQSLRGCLHWCQTYWACAQSKLDAVQLQLRHQHHQPMLRCGMKGTTEDGSMLTASEPPSLTPSPGMLFHWNISPVHPNLWEKYNSDKTCLSFFLPPSQHQLFLSLPWQAGYGAEGTRVLGFQSLATRSFSKYILYSLGMQSEVSPCRSHIPGGIPGAWRTIFSSTMKHFLWGGTFWFYF